MSIICSRGIEFLFNPRYEKKLQVSKCEKFGHGKFVSQISTTVLGMQALYKTGLFTCLIDDLWQILDTGMGIPQPNLEDNPLSADKAVSNIVKLLCSHQGLAFVLKEESNAFHSTKGESDSQIENVYDRNTLHHLIYSMILLDERYGASDSYEDSHTVYLSTLIL